MIIHGITSAQCAKLEELFAKLTPSGWVIPAWLILLKETAK